MKFLHTADWHVGKVLKGQPRHDEHEAVLGHLVELANAEDVDAILIPGDLFDSATPSPKAQGLVIETLLALRGHGRHVVAIAGNHDNGHLLDAVYRPLLGELGLHLLGTPKRPDAGGAVTLTTRAGEVVNVAVLPFLSHRYAVRAAETLLRETSEHTLSYSRRVREMVAALTAGFTPDAVNIVMTHGTLLGGRRGGGERDVQTSLDYELPATVFPASAHYTALGTCTAARTSRAPAPSRTQGHHWRSTSVKSPTSRSPWWSPPPPTRARRCGESRLSAEDLSLPFAEPLTRSSQPESRRPTPGFGSSSPSQPAPGSVIWSAGPCRMPWRFSSTKHTGYAPAGSEPKARAAWAAPPRSCSPTTSPSPTSTTRESPGCSATCWMRSRPHQTRP